MRRAVLWSCREGNTAFKNGDYKNAIIKYGEAIAIDPSNHTYWSNRSASYAGLDMWEEARDDARQCITVDKSFVKGYFRLATAQKNLNELEGARDTLNRGLAVEPRNADLKKNLKVSTAAGFADGMQCFYSCVRGAVTAARSCVSVASALTCKAIALWCFLDAVTLQAM